MQWFCERYGPICCGTPPPSHGLSVLCFHLTGSVGHLGEEKGGVSGGGRIGGEWKESESKWERECSMEDGGCWG